MYDPKSYRARFMKYMRNVMISEQRYKLTKTNYKIKL